METGFDALRDQYPKEVEMFDDIKKLQASYDAGIKEANIRLQAVKNAIHNRLVQLLPMGTKILVQIKERDQPAKKSDAVVNHIEGDFIVCEDNVKAKWDEVLKVLS
jgi:hypothetical protein